MKKLLAAFAVVAFLALHHGPVRAQSGHELFQKALAAERADGNLRAAIQLYEQVVKQFTSDRALAARALVRIAECYEKLGQRDAAKVYERVVREFGDQRESASLARTRLAAMQSPPLAATQTVRQLWSGSGVDTTGAPSPDGRYLTYTDWDTGDLAIRDLVQGTNRRLTNTGGWVASGDFAESSVWSPDGRQIAYAWFVEKATPPDGNCVCRYELRVISASGSDAAAPRVLHRSVDTAWIQPVAWTPNGQQILAVRQHTDRTRTLALFTLGDGAPRVVKKLGVLRWDGVALSPDGRFVAYGRSPDGENAHRDIFLLDLQSGSEERLVGHPSHDRSPIWTPDGAHLLFVSDRTGSDALWRLRFVAGRGEGAPVLVMSAPSAFGGLMGMARNGALYYWTGAQDNNIYITALDADGNGRSPQHVAIERFVNSNHSPAWSPDGNSLAFLWHRTVGDRPQSTRLVIHSLESGEAREVPLKVSPRQRIGWFPDGSSLLVAARDAQRRVAYYRVPLASGEAELVLTTAQGMSPATFRPQISADGQTLFYVETADHAVTDSTAQQLVRFALATGVKTVLFTERTITSFAVSPDATQVAYLHNNPGAPDQHTVLAVQSTTGGAPRQLPLPHSLKAGRFSGLAWSRDQRYVFYVKVSDRTNELWKAPVDGGPPARTGISMPGLIHLPDVHPDGRRIAFAARGGGTMPAIWVAEGISPPRRATAAK